MNKLSDPIKHLLSTKYYEFPIDRILPLLCEEQISTLARDKILSDAGYGLSDIKQGALDVVLDYIEYCLEDNAISEEEFRNVRLLKAFFGIREGDFIDKNLNLRMEGILSRQIAYIMEDGVIDYSEILHLENLQGLFGLSYNQFEKIVNGLLSNHR